MREGFRLQLVELGEPSASMCRFASDALQDATRALLDADLFLAERVIASDVRLDEMRARAEEVAVALLALEAPVARDLRIVISALRIVADCNAWAHSPSMSPTQPVAGIRCT